MTEELYASVGGERGMVGAQTPSATLSWFIFWVKIKSKVDYTHVIVFAFEVYQFILNIYNKQDRQPLWACI